MLIVNSFMSCCLAATKKGGLPHVDENGKALTTISFF
jgi:hypothetical protein